MKINIVPNCAVVFIGHWSNRYSRFHNIPSIFLPQFVLTELSSNTGSYICKCLENR